MVRAFCFLRGHLETEEANVRFDLRAENWETDFVMHFRFRFHLLDDGVFARIRSAVVAPEDMRLLRIHDCVRIFLQQFAADEQDELAARRSFRVPMLTEL